MAKPPKIQQDKFSDLNRKFSRNPGFTQIGNFKTDIPTEENTQMHSAQFLSQKSEKGRNRESDHGYGRNRVRRTIQKTSKIPHNLNRSRNAGRNTHSRNDSNLELVTSNILSDKLRDTLINSKKKPNRYSKKPSKNPELSSNEQKISGSTAPSGPYDSKPHKRAQTGLDHKKVNNQLLGNIIKNNNELFNSEKTSKKLEAEERPHSRDKYQRIHNKNIKNHSLNNKENFGKNHFEPFASADACGPKQESTEVYNLNQY